MAVWIIGGVVLDIILALLGIDARGLSGALAFFGGILWAMLGYNREKDRYYQATQQNAC